MAETSVAISLYIHFSIIRNVIYKFFYQFKMAEDSVEITLYIQFSIIRNVINNSQWRRRVWKSLSTYNFQL